MTGTDDATIRRVEREDLLSVVRVERACFDEPWSYTAFERFLGEAGFLVATDGSEVVGYTVSDVTPNHGRDIGHVKDLAVRRDERGRGVGRRLLDRALASLAVGGAHLVKLEVREGNDAARSLYRDVGFQPVRRVPQYYGDGEDALVLVLDVAEWQVARNG
ncbi:ribosomal protein S18-alanine N-acetyltransferase [Salinirarus marinus]|uniref:ribosomal protein S18-alanine N-acetyltransferase n=1 Tax=Salinirarus marinus TaxID=3068310 RepID=UPI003C6BF0C5